MSAFLFDSLEIRGIVQRQNVVLSVGTKHCVCSLELAFRINKTATFARE